MSNGIRRSISLLLPAFLSLAAHVAEASTLTAIVPSSVDSGESYSVAAYDLPQPPYFDSPYLKLYKNGVLVSQDYDYVEYTTSDTGPTTINWRFTSSVSNDVTRTTTVNVAPNTAPIGYFDNLTSSVTQGKTIYANGWAADNEMGSPITRVDVYLDGVDIANATLGGVRNDVASSYSRTDYANSGWSWSYDTSSLSLGTHTIQVRYVDSGGLVTIPSSKSFTVSSSVPSTTLSAADTTLYAGQSAHLTSVTTDPGSELTTHYMYYKAPGSSSWVSYSPNWASSGDSYWNGSQSASHTMSVHKLLNSVGAWQFRSRGRDTAGRYSSFKYVNVQASANPPATSLSSNTSSIYPGNSVSLTAAASDSVGDLTHVYIDEKAPGGSWVVSKYYWSGSARSSYNFVKSLALGAMGTWQFRARSKDATGTYGGYSSTKSVVVNSPLPYVASVNANPNAIAVGASLTVTATVNDPTSNLSNVYIEALPPGGSWTLFDSWSGSARASHSLAETTTLDVVGTWQFRARGRESGGAYGAYSSILYLVVQPFSASTDYDGDGMLDLWEVRYGFDPYSNDASGDMDGDGLTNGQEHAGGTDPNAKNSWYGVPAAATGGYGVNPILTVAPAGSHHDLDTTDFTLD